MTLNFTIKCEVQIMMYDQANNRIEEAPKTYKSGAGLVTVSPSNLYIVQLPCKGHKLLSGSDQ